MKSILFLILFCISQTSFSKTMVITDIDDTLRPTNRLYGSYLEQLDNISNIGIVFVGLPELFRKFDQQQLEIYYVSAIVSPLETFAFDFLQFHQFPQSENFFYKGWLEDTFTYKVATIQTLIDENSPDELILIGDNGEQDILVYQEIIKNNPQVLITSFIHKLYEGGTSLLIPKEQIEFLTAADLAAQMAQKNLISSDASALVISAVISHLDEIPSAQTIPDWANISSSDLEMNLEYFPIPLEQQDQLQTLLEKIKIAFEL